jgi:hypothetical protein
MGRGYTAILMHMYMTSIEGSHCDYANGNHNRSDYYGIAEVQTSGMDLWASSSTKPAILSVMSAYPS